MNIYLVVNPHGGINKGNRLLEEVRPVFEKNDAKITIVHTEYQGHAKELIYNLNIDSFDKFIFFLIDYILSFCHLIILKELAIHVYLTEIANLHIDLLHIP